jgi:hypothetical protein
MTKNGVAIGKDNKLKVNWQRFPRQMLTARCISEAVRLLAPQIVSGIYTPEEVQDFSSANQSLPAKVVQALPAPVQEVSDPKAEVVSRLSALLDKYEPKATEYLIVKGYIKNGQTYRDLDAITAQRILGNPSKIIGILEAV